MKINKWVKVSVVQQRWPEGGCGWEDVTEETSRKAGRDRLKEYRASQPTIPARLITRREINPDWTAWQAELDQAAAAGLIDQAAAAMRRAVSQ